MSCSDKDAIEEKIKDITDCPICLDAYKDPKILLCIHTFCVNCLLETGRKLNKNPGDMMPCPVCRREFAIPETGFGGLPRNFFMEKLTEIRQILKPSSSIILCDPCLEERESNAEAEIPSAEMYCVDCHQKLCQECVRHHKKNKVSKHHNIIPMEAQPAITMDDAFKTDNCEKHVNKPLEIYCSECQEVVCSMCFIERHNCHTGSDVNKAANDVKIEIQKSIEYWSSFLPHLDEKKQELDAYEANVNCKVEEVESELCRKRQELKELVDKDAESILRELELLKHHQLKKCNTVKDNIETLFASLEGYKVYCVQVTQLGSASDLCKAKRVLETATKELQQRQAFTDESSLKPLDVSLKITDLQTHLRHRGLNIIGNLNDSDDVVSRRRNSCAQPDDADAEPMDKKISLEIGLLSSEDGKTKPVEELELIAGDEVNEQNIRVDGALIKLTEETKKDLETESDKLQELQQKVEDMSTTINRLNHDLDIERLHVKELKQERDLLCVQVKHETNEQTIRDRVKDLEEQVVLLKGLLYGGETKAAKGTINWDGELTLSTTLETFHDFRVKSYQVFGIAILGNELFVANSENVVMVHDLSTLKLKRRWKLPRTGESIVDMKQCNANKCLYLVKVDSKTYNEIIRVDLNGNEIVAWSVETAEGQISVTRESNVLFTAFGPTLNQYQLHEYTPDGKLVQVINLPWNSGIESPSHAIKMTSDHFLVCHGDCFDPLSRVCIVDLSGDVIKSFGEPRASGRLQTPLYMYMEIDGAGNVLVFDSNLSRVVLLSRNLEFRRHLCIPESVGEHSWKMRFDESNRRVFIVKSGKIGQVHVYSI